MSRSRNSILGVAASAALFLSTEARAEQTPKAEGKPPVPPVSTDTEEEQDDAVLDLQQILKEKARTASESEDAEWQTKPTPIERLRASFEFLPNSIFPNSIKPMWETLVEKLTPDVLKVVEKLENPRIYGVNKNGELVIGDGNRKVPNFTLGMNYFEVRKALIAQGLALLTRDEYEVFNQYSMESSPDFGWTWLESGDKPSTALVGRSSFDGRLNPTVNLQLRNPQYKNKNLGARRVFRLRLDKK